MRNETVLWELSVQQSDSIKYCIKYCSAEYIGNVQHLPFWRTNFIIKDYIFIVKIEANCIVMLVDYLCQDLTQMEVVFPLNPFGSFNVM